MNWYKKAQIPNPDSFSDRNIINEKIRFFEHAITKLDRLAKIVFQDGIFAKQASLAIANDKKLSSNDNMRDLLLQANLLALDSPWKFAELCFQVSDLAENQVATLKKQRQELISETMPNKMKGWVDDHS